MNIPLRVCVQVTYSTYTEGDYDAIWKHYAYHTDLPDWFYKVGSTGRAWWRQTALAVVWARRRFAGVMHGGCAGCGGSASLTAHGSSTLGTP